MLHFREVVARNGIADQENVWQPMVDLVWPDRPGPLGDFRSRRHLRVDARRNVQKGRQTDRHPCLAMNTDHFFPQSVTPMITDAASKMASTAIPSTRPRF